MFPTRLCMLAGGTHQQIENSNCSIQTFQMQLRHKVTVSQPAQTDPNGTGQFRITALAWAPQSYKLAIAGSKDQVVWLYNEQGDKKDKFPTKTSSDTKV